jgi:hypothetical protein
MFRELLPTAPATVTLAGAITVSNPAAAGRAGTCPHPDTSVTSMVPTTDVEDDGRCAIDAEAYYLDYREGEFRVGYDDGARDHLRAGRG